MLHAFMHLCKYTFKASKQPALAFNTIAFSRKHSNASYRAVLPIQMSPQFSQVNYVPLIRQCGSAKLLCDGKHIHAIIVENRHGQDTLVMNLIIQMYGKCGALHDARATFQGMEKRNVFSWTIMIGAYAQYGHDKEALRLFRQMEPAGVTPNKVTFITVVSLCASMADLAEGKLVHSCIEVSPFISDVAVGNALVNMYDKCGSVKDACLVFGKISERNAISWNAMIAAHAQHGQGRESLQLFQQMQLEDVIPDNVTFVNTLDVYASQTSLVECKRMHARIMVSGFEPDVVLGTAIVCMYGKCGSMDYAWMMFNHMPHRNTISWNAVLAAFEECVREKEVLQLFQQMQLEGMIPDKVTFVTIFSACANSQLGLCEGKRVHSCILYSGFDWDLILWNALINMYGKGGSLGEALRVFEETPKRDVVSWNAVIAAYAQHDQGQEALQLFQQMQLEGVMPNKVTFVSVVDACASKAAIVDGKCVHARIVCSGFEEDMVERNALLNMYGKCGSVEHAWSMFDKMSERDVISWSAMAAAYAQHGHGLETLQLFGQMQTEGMIPNEVTFVSILDARASQLALAEGKSMHTHIQDGRVESDLVIGNALVNMYSKCHSLEAAWMIFDKMPKRDVVSWTAMIAAYAQEGRGDVALRLFYQMQDEGVSPNKITFISILDAFASQAALAEGHSVHAYLVGNKLEADMEVGNATLSMYGKCGSLEDAQRVFDRMPERNVVSWTTMIATYSQHGLGKKAYKLYLEMQRGGIVPNQITFVSVLSACSHAGLVDEGCGCFTSMGCDYGIAPTLEHYNCLVDLFGRAGKLEEGIDVIHKMPMDPTATTWMTFLGACKMHQNLERALYAAEKIFELDSNSATSYVLLSNIFAAAGRCDDAVHIRTMMFSKGLKKPLGFSSIVVKSKVHEFCTGDGAHPQLSEICAELKSLDEQMKKEGYARATKLVQEVEEEEEEEDEGKGFPSYHSEKLAIAFGLISTPPSSPLIITKNLRVCHDCHSAIKYISKVAQRQIVVRDNHRFHHFKDGMCSCSNYW